MSAPTTAASHGATRAPCGDADADPGAGVPLRLGTRRCVLVCVDDVVPMHLDAGRGLRPRLVYRAGEVAHFELDGHRWSLVLDASEPRGDAQDAERIHALLTNRELQIVQLICMGLLTKQVADRLHLSEFTVRSYLKTVYCKLGVRSRGAMVYRYAQAFTRGAPPGLSRSAPPSGRG